MPSKRELVYVRTYIVRLPLAGPPRCRGECRRHVRLAVKSSRNAQSHPAHPRLVRTGRIPGLLCSEIQHAHAVRRRCELAELRAVGVSVRARLLLHLQADQSWPPLFLTSGSVLAALRFANEAGQCACDVPGRLWQSSETWRKRCAAYEPCSSAGMKRLLPLLPRCRGVARRPNCGSESTLPGQIEEEKKREKERRALEVKQASIEGRTAKLDVSTRPTCFANVPCGRSEPSCRRRRSSSPCRPRLASDLEPNKAAGFSWRTFRILRSRRVLLGRRQANIEWV